MKASDLIAQLEKLPPDVNLWLGVQPVRDSNAVPEHDWVDRVRYRPGGDVAWIFGARYRTEMEGPGEQAP